MQGIEFEEDKDLRELQLKAVSGSTEKPSFVMKLLEKVGVTDKRTANIILLGIAIIFFSITIYLYSGLLESNTPSKRLTPEQIQAQLRLMQGAPNSSTNRQ